MALNAIFLVQDQISWRAIKRPIYDFLSVFYGHICSNFTHKFKKTEKIVTLNLNDFNVTQGEIWCHSWTPVIYIILVFLYNNCAIVYKGLKYASVPLNLTFHWHSWSRLNSPYTEFMLVFNSNTLYAETAFHGYKGFRVMLCQTLTVRLGCIPGAVYIWHPISAPAIYPLLAQFLYEK